MLKAVQVRLIFQSLVHMTLTLVILAHAVAWKNSLPETSGSFKHVTMQPIGNHAYSYAIMRENS